MCTNLALFTSKTVLNKYFDVFICCLNSHSDGTHLLHPLSVLMSKHNNLHLRWPEGDTILNYSFK